MNLLDRLRSGRRASQCDDGISFAIRRQKPGRQIAHARSGCSNRDTRFASQSSNATGDEGGILLVSVDHGLNRRGSKRVKYFVDLRAGNSENVADTLPLKGFDHNLSAGLWRR